MARPVVIQARFIGEDGSLGFRHGEVYELRIEGDWITEPQRCPYSSVESFLRNWQPIEEPTDD